MRPTRPPSPPAWAARVHRVPLDAGGARHLHSGKDAGLRHSRIPAKQTSWSSAAAANARSGRTRATQPRAIDQTGPTAPADRPCRGIRRSRLVLVMTLRGVMVTAVVSLGQD